ncbi:unnamed protein product [Prorocentrum cordatum]|uniref:Uncharacterized protein n=1 Tax=Prorocentrum cordatum TaxID=2364126 RepID=A0ABN9S0F4_9DINO|nr:unnamed protein product [Polarella glacialis]
MPPPGFRTGAYSPAVPLSAPGATPRLYSYGGERTPAPTPSMTPRVQAARARLAPTQDHHSDDGAADDVAQQQPEPADPDAPHGREAVLGPGLQEGVLAHSVQLIQLPPTVQVAEHDPAAAKS